MVAADEEAMRDGENRSVLAAATRQAVELCVQVGPRRMHDGPSEFTQNAAQVLVAVRGLPTEAFACADLVAGTESRPRSQMVGAGEARHVGANLAQDCRYGRGSGCR